MYGKLKFCKQFLSIDLKKNNTDSFDADHNKIIVK